MQTVRTPKQPKAPKLKFEFSRKNYLDGTNSFIVRPGRKYIYVIHTTSSAKNMGGIPIYVGQTTDLQNHFTGHQAIEWHYAKYNDKAVIHVIASVPDGLADKIERQTVSTLLHKGYILLNTMLNKKESPLSNFTGKELEKYGKDVKPLNTSLPETYKTLRYFFTKEESDNKAVLQNTAPITKAELVRLAKQRHYANNQSASLSLRLANVYDPLTGTSIILVPSSVSKTDEDILHALKIQIKGLVGDWYLKGEQVELNKPLVFYPSESFLGTRFSPVKPTSRPALPEETKTFDKERKEAEVTPTKNVRQWKTGSVIEHTYARPKAMTKAAEAKQKEKDQIYLEIKKITISFTIVELVEAIKRSEALSKPAAIEAAIEVAEAFSPTEGYSNLPMTKKRTNTDSIGALWRYEVRHAISLEKKFYPTTLLIKTVLDARK